MPFTAQQQTVNKFTPARYVASHPALRDVPAWQPQAYIPPQVPYGTSGAVDTVYFPAADVVSGSIGRGVSELTGSETLGQLAELAAPSPSGLAKGIAGIGKPMMSDIVQRTTTGNNLGVDAMESGVAGTRLNPPTTKQDAMFAVNWGDKSKLYVESKLRHALDRHTKGITDAAQFNNEVAAIQGTLMTRQVQKASQIPEYKRGYNNLIAVLRKEVANNRIASESADTVEWFAKKNPTIADELAISFDKTRLEEGAGGLYSTRDKMVVLRGIEDITAKLKRGLISDITLRAAPHELLHHTERLLPQPWRDEIRQLWWDKAGKELNKAVNANDKEMVEYMRTAMSGRTKDAARLLIQISKGRGEGVFDKYQFADASEFWAENASSILKKRATGSFGQKVGSYYSEFADQLKNAAGLDNDNPVYKSLRGLKTLKTKTHGGLIVQGNLKPKTGMSQGEKVLLGSSVLGLAAAAPELMEWKERRIKEKAEIE